MKVPFGIEELDRLLKACISFSRDHDQHFYTGNICGREGVPADGVVVKRMMTWIAEMDAGLLEDCGFAQDNLYYFRLGLHAEQMMADGGFGKYLSRRRRAERIEKTRLWAPIGISVVALIISVAALQKPRDTSPTDDNINQRMENLAGEQMRLEAELVALREAQAAPSDANAPIEPSAPPEEALPAETSSEEL